jgi:uncharacterized protein
MLKKISGYSNVITWLEIPVVDLDRARKFYETILDISMETMEKDPNSVFFPRQPDTIMAQSGVVSGTLTLSKKNSPSKTGPLIYLNATPSIDAAISKIEGAGGKILAPKTKIPAGLIAIFEDSEGNRMALHAAQ